MRDNDLLNAAIAYAEAGLAVLPLTPHGKVALVKDWPQKATSDIATIRSWWAKFPSANIGLHVGKSGLVVVDIDPRNGGDASLKGLKAEHGDAWLSNVCVNTGGGGHHYIYASCSSGVRLPAQIAPGIDLKHGVGYIVAPPSIHPSGRRYLFAKGGLAAGELDFLPALPQWITGPTALQAEAGQADTGGWIATVQAIDPETPENVERVRSALEVVSADCSRDDWRNVLFAITSTGWDCATALAREWSMTAAHRFEEGAFLNIVENAKDRPNAITLGTLFSKAKANGWIDPVKTPSVGFETYGDLSNGRRFAQKYRGQLLHTQGRWYAWCGSRWGACQHGEQTAAAKTIAEDIIKETLAAVKADGTEAAKRNHTHALAVHRSIKRLEAMVQSAASEPGMSIANPGLFDADPWKIGVRNGLVDLRNGEILRPSPDLLISRQAGVAYDPQALCPRWLGFLDQALAGDAEMIAFMQRLCGYILTGFVNEEILAFIHGVGANGKSVFANVIAAAMGDYAVTVRAALLARDPKGSGSDAEREKARLPGARLALVNETGQGDVFDDQRIKEITSRERVSARHLYGESFDFMPTHKLVVRGNHLPGALDASDGFWRRIVLIHFSRKIKPSECVADFDQRIIDEELTGVFAWMVEGCLKWGRKGLRVPSVVSNAVASYRKDTDLLGEWLRLHCVQSRGDETSLARLFHSYETFTRDAHIKPPSRNLFGRQLAARGYGKRESNGKVLYSGIAIRMPWDDEL